MDTSPLLRTEEAKRARRGEFEIEEEEEFMREEEEGEEYEEDYEEGEEVDPEVAEYEK